MNTAEIILNLAMGQAQKMVGGRLDDFALEKIGAAAVFSTIIGAKVILTLKSKGSDALVAVDTFDGRATFTGEMERKSIIGISVLFASALIIPGLEIEVEVHD